MNDPIAIFLNALTPSAQREFMRLHLEQHGPTYQLHSDGGFKSVQVGVDMAEAMRKFNPVVYALCVPAFTDAGLGRLVDDLEKPATFEPGGVEAPGLREDEVTASLSSRRAVRPHVTINVSGPVGVGKSVIASGIAYALTGLGFGVEVTDTDIEPRAPAEAWNEIEVKPHIVITETVEQPRRVGMPPALGAPYGNAPDPREFATDFVGDLAAAVMDAPIGLGKSGYAAAAAESWDPRVITAPDLLRRAAQHMQDRAAQRDQPEGERSMRRTVDAFNALLGTTLSERDGWLFMAVLKIARATNTPTGDLDDYEDLAAYAALAGESVAKGEQA